MKRERRKKSAPFYGLTYFGHRRSNFIAEEVATQPRFGALSIFKLNDPGSLNRFLHDAEETGGDLGDDVIAVRF